VALAEERDRAYRLADREIPHSGKPKQLIEKFGISSGRIVNAVKSALSQHPVSARQTKSLCAGRGKRRFVLHVSSENREPFVMDLVKIPDPFLHDSRIESGFTR